MERRQWTTVISPDSEDATEALHSGATNSSVSPGPGPERSRTEGSLEDYLGLLTTEPVVLAQRGQHMILRLHPPQLLRQ